MDETYPKSNRIHFPHPSFNHGVLGPWCHNNGPTSTELDKVDCKICLNKVERAKNGEE